MNVHKAISPVRPYAEPVVLERAYTDDQVARFFRAVRNYGPIRQIQSLYVSDLDQPADPCFRGELGSEGLCLDPEVDPLYYNPRLLEAARNYRGSAYAMPRQLAFNGTAPSASHDLGHRDTPAYRGMWHVDAPPWLLNVMGQSGLFDEFAVKMVQIVTWFWRGQWGGFTYWPDGPEGDPRQVAAPNWNRAIIAENQYMFHRAESTLPPGVEADLPGMTHRATLNADPDDADSWIIRNRGQTIARYATPDLRWMLHWSCTLFDDRREVDLFFEHTDDLTLARVMDMFRADLPHQGEHLVTYADALAEPAVREQLERVYGVGRPQRYPA